MGPHTTSVADAIASESQLKKARQLDPIARYRTWLEHEGIASADFFEDCDKFATERTAAVRDEVVALAPPPADEASRFVFERPWGEAHA
jgi:pyruvate dehydrogenase E1 component alpha subunit